MAQFQYVNKQGGLTTFDAADQKTALAQLSSFADADKNSGVLAVQGAPQQTPKPIPAASLQTTQQPVTVPPFNPAPAPVIPDVATLMGAFNQPTADQTAAQNEQSDILAQTKAILERQGTQAARQGELETQQGLPQLQKQLNEINAQITNLTGSAFSAQQAAEGRLAPTFAIQGEQAQIERQRSVQTFGLAAAAQALQGNIALANDNVQRALQSEFGRLESKLQYQKLLLDLNRDKLSAADQKKAAAFEIQLNERSRLLEEQKANRAGVYEVFLQAAQNKADNLTLQRIQQAQTPEQAAQIAQQAGALVPPQEAQTQVVKLDNGQTVLLDTQTGQVIKNIGGAAPVGGAPAVISDSFGNKLEYGTPEYLIERLKATAGSKTKLTQSEREQVGKFANVVALTENLVGSLSKTTNDPIIGYLKSLNPYDFDARAVNAQVTALVPSVARGLYGEVGVLTDADIDRYLKTLPNIRSTPDQNKFIAMMTLANAKRSYEQTLMNAANSGVNVSGFVDTYKSMSDKLNTLEAELGVGFEGGTYQPYSPKETQDVEFSSTPSPQAQGYISSAYNWAKGLFGF